MIEVEFIKDAKEAFAVKEYLRSELRQALISKIDVVKTPIVTRIVVKAARPAIVIGRKGQNIRKITEEIKERFGIDNAQIEVVPVQDSTLDAQVQAERIALALEKGMAWRPLLHRTLARIMGAGAKGAEIMISGKLGARGAKSRTERVHAGYMKKCGEPANLVDTGYSVAKTKWGTIGVHVSIVHPDVVFPDHIDVPQPVGGAHGDSKDEGAQE